MKRPNIVMIMTDQLRGDCLGIAGHPDVKTPYLDSLAAKGTLFDHAYSACPSCVPARAAIHTGLSQEHHGRVGYEDLVDWNYPHTLAGELSDAGYYTQCVGKMHVHPLRHLMGFQHIDLHDGYLHAYRYPNTPYYESQKVADDYFYWLKQEKGIDADVTDSGMECNSWISRPWIYEESCHPTNWVTGRSIDFLRRRDTDKPFFLMASYLRPHPPFDAPSCYFDLYRDKVLTPPAIGDWEDHEELKKFGRIYDSATGPIDPELIRQAQIGYYACITHLDHQIGRLIQALVEHQLMDNTIFLFTSDHGEELCDHHLFRKSRPYEGSCHIPMIISGPRNLTGALPGQVCHSLVELRDIMPTLLDIAGAPIPPEVDGKSMMPSLQDVTHAERTWLHGEHALGMHSNHYIVTNHDKYIWYSQTGQEQYFDLAKDPHELHDLIQNPRMQTRIHELRQTLIAKLADREEGYSDGTSLLIGQTPQTKLQHSLL
ncbi:MAG: arylsulfatase [Hungatella sp.]